MESKVGSRQHRPSTDPRVKRVREDRAAATGGAGRDPAPARVPCPEEQYDGPTKMGGQEKHRENSKNSKENEPRVSSEACAEEHDETHNQGRQWIGREKCKRQKTKNNKEHPPGGGAPPGGGSPVARGGAAQTRVWDPED